MDAVQRIEMKILQRKLEATELQLQQALETIERQAEGIERCKAHEPQDREWELTQTVDLYRRSFAKLKEQNKAFATKIVKLSDEIEDKLFTIMNRNSRILFLEQKLQAMWEGSDD